MYVDWTLSTKQNDIFFGDIVQTCYRITLEAGWTFFIPTGTTPMHCVVYSASQHSFTFRLNSFSTLINIGLSEVLIQTNLWKYYIKTHYWCVIRQLEGKLQLLHEAVKQLASVMNIVVDQLVA